jgi:hypothetical protein
MDVDEHERLINFTLSKTQMFCRSLFFRLSFFFWTLCCLFFCLLDIVLSVLLSFGHCVVCPSIYRLSFPLWYLQTILVFHNEHNAYHKMSVKRLLAYS